MRRRSLGSAADRGSLASLALWMGGIAGGAWLFGELARGVPNGVIEDDAYFYLQIAWNLASGLGPTFDGLHLTSGFHLLWMGVLAPLAFVVQALGGGKHAFLVATFAVSLAMAALASAAAFRGPAERALALAIFVICGVTMESTLLGVLVLPVARGFLGERALSSAATFALAALIPLTRIDYAWLVPVLVLLQATEATRLPVASSRAAGGLAWRAALAGTAIGVAVHLGVMQAAFGAWRSVSSAYKADLVVLGPAWFLRANLTHLGNLVRFAVLAGMAAIAFGAGGGERRHARPLMLLVTPMLALGALGLVARLRDWYFIVPMLLALLGASRMAGALRPRAWQAAAAGYGVLLAAALVGNAWLNAGDIRRTAQFVRDANHALDPRDIVYGVDGTGFAGWWLDARVIAGDGLVHSWDYRARLLRNGLAGYLDDVGATHVLRNRRFSRSVIVAWQGLVVREDEVVPVASAGPTRNRLVAYELYARGRSAQVVRP